MIADTKSSALRNRALLFICLVSYASFAVCNPNSPERPAGPSVGLGYHTPAPQTCEHPIGCEHHIEAGKKVLTSISLYKNYLEEKHRAAWAALKAEADAEKGAGSPPMFALLKRCQKIALTMGEVEDIELVHARNLAEYLWQEAHLDDPYCIEESTNAAKAYYEFFNYYLAARL